MTTRTTPGAGEVAKTEAISGICSEGGATAVERADEAGNSSAMPERSRNRDVRGSTLTQASLGPSGATQLGE